MPPSKSADPDDITSVAKFIDAIRDLPDVSPGFRTYRGERNASWNIAPGILRRNYSNLLKHERDAIREIQAVHPSEFYNDTSMFDRLVRMQHYGLPTRLLDVTGNPLVALYFATEEPKDAAATDGVVSCFSVPRQRMKYFDSDTVSCVANIANLSEIEKDTIHENVGLDDDLFNELPEVDRLLQFIRAEKSHFRAGIKSKELDTRWFVWPKMNNRRIIAQRGAFIIYGLSLSRSYPKGARPIRSTSLEIPARAKGDIRSELDLLGINQSSLFPEIDKAADDIKSRYA